MRVLFITRSTLYTSYGGDTVQILSTAKYLRRLGINIEIKLTNEPIDYQTYDLMHIFNIIRPADALIHVRKSGLPYVISTIFLDQNEYEKKSTGFRRILGKYLSPDMMEYIKAIARWIKNGEAIRSREYLFWGHRRSVCYLAKKAATLLPNSESEYKRFSERYNLYVPYQVIYNGIDTEVFLNKKPQMTATPDNKKVVCVARIEGNKNQLNLIKALNNTEYTLTIIGKPSPNHQDYYNECRSIASANIHFIGFVPQEELSDHYLSAKVHVLPSWNETCGLSSLEAAYLNCNIVITDKGDTREYYGNDAWYCDPSDTSSIYNAVDSAAKADLTNNLHKKISEIYNWDRTAKETLSVYKKIVTNKTNITN